MSNTELLVVIVCVLFALMSAGNWVFASLGLAGVLGIWLFGANVPTAVSLQMWSSLNSFVLTAIPLFIFMGEVMLRSGISDSLYSGISMWVGKLPGGLLHSNIASCALFAAISGSSIATSATVGTVAIPDQTKRGYDKQLVIGSLSAAGTLGILIPPSLAMIVYGSWMECSVAQLFMGGVVPGILLAVLFSVYIAARCTINPRLTPRVEASWVDRLHSVKDIWPGFMIIAFIMLSIYLGVMTPTETAAVASATSLLIALALRKLTFGIVTECAMNTVRTTAMLMLIVVGAKIFVMALIYLKVTILLPNFIAAMNLSPNMVLVVIYVIYLVLGCFFDGMSLTLVTLPFVQPIILAMGIDPIWFGIVMVVLIEIGLITPPVGMNLYVIMGISAGTTLSEMTRAVVPFLAILMLGVLLLNLFPELALWLPSKMVGG
jgi:C4-dicarboxylate transporter DctM subunit